MEKYENSQNALTYISILIVFTEKTVWTFVVNYIKSGKEKHEQSNEETPLIGSKIDDYSDQEDLLLQKVEKERIDKKKTKCGTCFAYLKQITLNPPFIFLVLGKKRKIKNKTKKLK